MDHDHRRATRYQQELLVIGPPLFLELVVVLLSGHPILTPLGPLSRAVLSGEPEIGKYALEVIRPDWDKISAQLDNML